MTRMRTSSNFRSAPEQLFEDGLLHTTFFGALDNMRQKRLLTDITLIVDGEAFHAHKFVLAAMSDYFLTMFTGPMAAASAAVQLHGISEETMDNILHYMYSAAIMISEDNVEDLLDASSLFLLTNLRERCSKFMKDRLDDLNCLQIYCLAKRFSLQNLQETSLEYIAANFQDIATLPEFKMLSADELRDIISHGNLSIPSEDFVLEAALSWLKSDVMGRLHEFPSILYRVHLPFVSEYFLQRVASLPTFRVKSEILSVIRAAQSLTQHNWSASSVNFKLMEPKAWCSPRRCIQCIPSVLAIGGPNISIFNSELNQWQEIAKCKPRHSAGLVVCGTSVYMVGGSIEWKRKSSGEIFNFETNSWSVMSSMSTARSNFGLVQLKGKFYAVGGYNGDFPMKSAEVYDPLVDTWSPIPSMHHARDGACVTTDGERVFAISGYDGRQYLTSVEVYDPETNAWSVDSVSDVNTHRQNAMCAYHGGKIFVFGGYYDDTPISSVEVLDIVDDTWSYVSPLPEARHYSGAAALHGRIYICGGWSGQGLPVSTVLVYDIENDAWGCVAHLPAPSMVCAAAVDFPRKLMLRLFSRSDENDMPQPPLSPPATTSPQDNGFPAIT